MIRTNSASVLMRLFLAAAASLAVGTSAASAKGSSSSPPAARSGNGTAGTWSAYVWDSRFSTLRQTASVAPAGSVAGFPLQSNMTALLTTTSASGLVGNLAGKTLTATVSLTSTATIVYGLENGSGCPGTPANMRFFISSDPHTYSPSKAGRNETGYWWSNPASVPMDAPVSGAAISVPLAPGNWSDANGHYSSDSGYTAGFNATVANLQQVGVSFGGGCYYDTGIGVTSGTGSFTLNTIAAQ